MTYFHVRVKLGGQILIFDKSQTAKSPTHKLHLKGISIMANKPGRPATSVDPKITVRLPQSLIDRIDALAARQGTTRSDVIRERLDLDDRDGHTNDPLAFLSERQFRTLMRLQEAFEIVECGALKAFNPETVRVDGGQHDDAVLLKRGHRYVLHVMRDARLRLGDGRYFAFRDFLATDLSVGAVAAKHFDGRVRAAEVAICGALDNLQRFFGAESALALRAA
jgi:hypothetical protein